MDVDDFVQTLELMLLRDNSSEGLSEVERDRQRLADIIARTAVFMGEAGVPAAKDKLMGYYAALLDLDRGIAHPIFKAPTRKKGKPPPSSQVWRSRATVAIALDCYLKAKISFEVAFKKIKKVPNIQRLVTGSDLETSVENWRNTLNAGTVDNRIALERWQDAQRELKKFVAPDEMSRNMLLSKEADRLLKVVAGEIALIVSPRDAT